MSEERKQQELSVYLTDAPGSRLTIYHSCDDISTVPECNESNPVLSSCSNESSPAFSYYSDDRNHTVSWTLFFLRIFAIFSCWSGVNDSVTVPRVAGEFINEIDEFILGLQRYYKNIFDKELEKDEEIKFRQLLSAWNTFLQQVQGIPGDYAIISSHIKVDINAFIPRQQGHRGAQNPEDYKKWIEECLQRWNMFLHARAGRTLVTRWNVLLIIVGFIFYIVDLVSDVGTALYFASNGQWWQAMATLTLVYGAVIIQTIVKWTEGQIHLTDPIDRLRYVTSLLVNWPDLKQYTHFCRVEWQLHKSPTDNAHLIPEWHQRRRNVALMRFMEGACEACPQAILQLCLLVPDLYGDLTWTDYLRIAGTFTSLCTAGAALVNREKLDRIYNYTYLALSELVLLHMWAVPVTVSRLLSVSLFLGLHPYLALAVVVLHIVLRIGFCCSTAGNLSELNIVIVMCLDTLQFLISPFAVTDSVTKRRVYHAAHLLVNTAMMVAWALDTPLKTAHPDLYTAIICVNAVMFAVGLVGWQRHEKLWPGSYPKRNDELAVIEVTSD